jgi:hypothetical protein
VTLDSCRSAIITEDIGGLRVCWLTFCLIEGMFASFDNYNDKLINYDVPAEVQKVVNQ